MHPPGLLLLDSDVFVLLAGAGLLPSLIVGTGYDLETTRRLDPLPYMLRGGSMVGRYPQGVRQKALAWCAEIPAVEEAPDPELIDQLTTIQDVDPGEAFLFALVAEMDHALLVTGDKRACRAIQRSVDLRELKARLAGKVLCLEAVLQLLLEQLGYAELVDALNPVREYNQTLRILLSQGALTPETSFRDGLESYLADLAAQADDLLFNLG